MKIPFLGEGLVFNLIASLKLFAFQTLQKFELKRHPFLLQLMGNLPEEELEQSTLAAKLNGFAAELCPPKIQRQINARIDEIIRRGWPILREV